MADQTRHTAITNLIAHIKANIATFADNGAIIHVSDGPVALSQLTEEQLPFLQVLEGEDQVDEQITPGRDIWLAVGLYWNYLEADIQTARDIEDSIIKQCYRANIDQLSGAVIQVRVMPSTHPFVWPGTIAGLEGRGRVVRLQYRQET